MLTIKKTLISSYEMLLIYFKRLFAPIFIKL